MRITLPLKKRLIVLRRYAGFTLVEMLVAVALVTILMTMFAQIFGLAASILSQQRGIAANDQTERSLRTVIREDLDNRTFRKIVPFVNGAPLPANPERGYFHIDEGDVFDDSDDILQFTVDTQRANQRQDAEPLYGAALTFNADFTANPNQPDFDDDLLSPNETGASRFGEVVYFLRNGTLYRRVMLIRDKDDGSGGYAPKDSLGTVLIPGTYAGNFWTDFDYSAVYDNYIDLMLMTPPPPPGFTFLGDDHLDNDSPDSVPSFGIPRYRFGFCPSFNDINEGKPRKSATGGFIGRFTRSESSDPAFVYPLADNPLTNPLNPTMTLTYNPATGKVNELSNGTRYSEDVLLTNVHSFDIKVWDPGFVLGVDNGPGNVTDTISGGVGDDDGDGIDDNIEELGAIGTDDWHGPDGMSGTTDDADATLFLDLGHGLTDRAYSFASSANNQIGNCYDTWHRFARVGGEAELQSKIVPYNPLVGSTQVPLRMIRIQIRYVDQKSDQMRDVIIVHSLTD